MLIVETDLTAGGRPQLRVDADTTRDGERLLYLNVTAWSKGFKGDKYGTNVFIGLTREEVAQIREGIERLEEVADAAVVLEDGM